MAHASPSLARKAALGIAAAAAIMTSSASAAEFTQAECKGIAGTATGIVKTLGAKTLSTEFRQSFVNWLGPDLRCDGPKDIIIVSHNDSAALATIRDMLLSGSKPLSLQKAGLRVIVRDEKQGAVTPTMQRRTDAGPAPTVN